MAACSLRGVAERVEGLLRAQAAARGVRLVVEDMDDDVYCYGDAGQITQVLLNIVLNAVQACGEGDDVHVTCAPVEAQESGAVARIDVVDTGPGIPQEIRESLFDPFVTTKTRGTGLGLAICQHIVEEHEGTIRCDFLDKGTRFSIELPRRDKGGREQHGT
jgi:signal transduction histidine kinase